MLEAISNLAKRSYDTYKGRLEAHKRLSARGSAWNTALVALSLSTVIASVGLLSDSNIYGPKGDSLIVSVSILMLIVSLVISSANYGSRSARMEESYKRIQKISVQAENLRDLALGPPKKSIEWFLPTTTQLLTDQRIIVMAITVAFCFETRPSS
ncbi:SLATT domain-containing protein [Kineococcus sp. R8]|nr:SLATT domain-containing protein [Kineococcus siccus]